MNIFDLLFIGLLLTAVGTLFTAAGFAVAGRFGHAGRILRRLLLCASVYMAVVVAVSLFSSSPGTRANGHSVF